MLKLADFAETLFGIEPSTNFTEPIKFIEETDAISISLDSLNIKDTVVEDCIFVFGKVVIWRWLRVDDEYNTSEAIYSLTAETMPTTIYCLATHSSDLCNEKGEQDDEKMQRFLDVASKLRNQPDFMC